MRGKLLHPFAELINHRYNTPIPKEGETSVEYSMISRIPQLEKIHYHKAIEDLNKCLDFDLFIKQLPVSYKCNSDDIRLIFEMKEGINDVVSVILCFNIIGWVNDKSGRNLSDLVVMLSAMNRVSSNSYRRSLNFTFEYLIRSIIGPPYLQIEEECYQHIFLHFRSNKTLDSYYFPLLIQLFRMVINSGYSSVIQNMIVLIEELVSKEFLIVSVEDKTPLVLLLQQFISRLDITCFTTVCRLSNSIQGGVLADSFVLVPSALFSFIISNSTSENLPNIRKEIVNTITNPTINEILCLKHEFIEDQLIQFEKGLLTPPFNRIKQTKAVSISKTVESLSINIGHALRYANIESRITFLHSIIDLLSTVSLMNLYYEIFSSFLIILSLSTEPEMLPRIVQKLCLTVIFSQPYNVFVVDSYYPYINSLRQSVFELVSTIDSSQLFLFLTNSHQYPILFVEHLIRLLFTVSSFNCSMVSSEIILVHIIEVAYKLRFMQSGIDSSTIFLIRSSLISCIDLLSYEKESAKIVFTNPNFVIGLLFMIYESSLSHIVLSMVIKFLLQLDEFQVLHQIPTFFEEIIRACEIHSIESDYVGLVYEVASSLITLISNRPSFSILFEGIITPLISFIMIKPDLNMLSIVLDLMVHLAFTKNLYVISCEDIKSLIVLINRIEGTNPSLDTQNRLFKILSGISNYGSGMMYILKNLSVFPVLFATLGLSNQFILFLDVLLDLAKFSDNNCRLMHQADIDMLFLQFISKEKDECIVHYIGNDCSLFIPEEYIQSKVIPLLEKISVIKCDNAIVNMYINMILNASNEKKNQHIQWFCRIFKYCFLFPPFLLPLGIKSERLIVTGSNSSLLNQGFSINFSLRIDTPLANNHNDDIPMFSIFDNQNTVLHFYYRFFSIYVRLETPLLKTSVLLAKGISIPQWSSYTMIFSFSADNVGISTYRNTEPLNGSDLYKFQFADGPLKIQFGGGMINPQISGYLSSFHMYNTILNENQIPILVRSFEMLKLDPLFSTTLIPAQFPVQPTVHNIKDFQLDFHQQYIDDRNLLWSFVRGNNVNILSTVFQNLNIIEFTVCQLLDIIGLAFSRSQVIQNSFSSVIIILKSLYSNTSSLTFGLYLSFYQVLCNISDNNLKIDWFEHLVVNIWLWSKAKSLDFLNVLEHWSHVVVCSFSNLFQKKSFLKRFIDQFKIIFCFYESKEQIIFETKIPHGIEKIHDVKTLLTARKLFSGFVSRVSLIQITPEEITLIFQHICSCISTDTILQMLSILQNATPSILLVGVPQEQLDSLHHLLENKDIEVIENAILALHQLAGDRVAQNIQAAAFQLRTYPQRDLVFEHLFKRIHQYPNLFPLLCILALKMGDAKIMILSEALNYWITNQNNSKVVLYPYWFVWPIIMSLHASDDGKNMIFRFIGHMLNLSPRSNDEFYHILYFILFIAYATPLDDKICKIFLQYAIQSVDVQNIELANRIINGCFTSSFFHLWANSHHKLLLNTFRKSPFGLSGVFNPERTIFQDELFDVTHLEHLMFFDVTSLNIRFEVRLDDKGCWLDDTIASLAYKLFIDCGLDIPKYSDIKSYFLLYRTSDNLKSEAISQNSLSFFESQQTEYSTKFTKVFHPFLAGYRRVMENARRTVIEAPSFASGAAVDRSNKSQNIEFDFYINLSSPIQLSQATMRRDRTTCVNYCSMKLKQVSKRKKTQSHKIGDVVFEQSCMLITAKRIRDSSFRLCKTFVQILCADSDKVFSISQIRLLLTRKRAWQENSVEFYLSDGRTYLVDFTPTDNSVVIRQFQKLMVFENQFIQTIKAPELVALFPLTDEWAKGMISTFEYLMKLNILSGRSFNDLELYPIFPPICQTFSDSITIKDFSSCISNTIVRPGKSKYESALTGKNPISPEYYYLAENFMQSDKLPNWAQSSHEIVYVLRRFIESKDVSMYLPKWIDKTYGIGMPKDSPHRQVFTKIHIPRNIPNSPLEKYFSAHIPLISFNIEYVGIMKSKQPNTLHFFCVLANYSIETITLILGPKVTIKQARSMQNAFTDSNIKFSSSSKGIVSYSLKDKIATIYRDGKVDCTHFIYSETDIVSYCDMAFLLCPDRSTVSYIADKTKKTKPLVLCYLPSRIDKIASNHQFKTFAVATQDGYISVRCLKSGREVMTTNVGSIVEHLVITNHFGYVVAFTKDKIVLLSVNGEKIKEVKSEKRIEKVYQFRDLQDFDYIAYEDESHNISYFEAFYPETNYNIKTCIYPTTCITYIPSKSCFVILYKDGTIDLIPSSLKSR